MLGISLWQPHATACALGSKLVETRSWATHYRGPLAIHASKRKHQGELLHYHSCWNWQGAMRGAKWSWGPEGYNDIDRLPFGAIIATCTLVDVRRTETFTVGELDKPRSPEGDPLDLYQWTERQMGNFEPGRYGWVLRDMRPLREPIPFKGQRQLFHVPDELLRAA